LEGAWRGLATVPNVCRPNVFWAALVSTQFNEGTPSDRGGDEMASSGGGGGVGVVAHPAKRIVATKMMAGDLDTQPLCET